MGKVNDMKKVWSVLLALALCAALLPGALADWTLTEMSEVTSSPQWVSGSNFLRLRQNDGYYIYDVNGNELTKSPYNSVDYEFGYFAVSAVDGGLNSFGVLDEAGNLLIPHQYADIKFLDSNWVLGVKLVKATADNYDYTSWSSSDAYYLIETVDIYNMTTGACVASLPRANYKDSAVVENVLQIEDRATGTITAYDSNFNALGTSKYMYSTDYGQPELKTFRENGQSGLMDAAGNVVLAPSFVTIYDFYGDYATVSTGDKEGLIDRKGNLVVPVEYDDVKRSYYGAYNKKYDGAGYNAAGYFAVIKDGKLGWVNAAGEVTCEPKYSEKIMDLYGASAIYTDMENNMHILAADGTDTVVGSYESIYCLEYSDGKLFKVTDENYNYGVIDWHGEVVVPCEYYGVELSGDGQYLLVDVDYSTSKLYAISDGTPVAQAEAPATETQTAQGGVSAAAGRASAGVQAALSALQGDASAAQETEAVTEAPAEQTSGANAAVVTLIDSATAMLDADAAANKAAVSGLLTSATTLLGEGSASTMISSALTLLEVDAAANAASIKTILETVKTML